MVTLELLFVINCLFINKHFLYPKISYNHSKLPLCSYYKSLNGSFDNEYVIDIGSCHKALGTL